MAQINYLLFILLGVTPSLIWLAYYLRKDAHPEPNWMIRKVFFWGMLVTFPAIVIELALRSLFETFPIPSFLTLILYVFIGIALVEELLKYLMVRFWVFKSPQLDEPVDVMLYMIIGALGFAALENMLVLFGLGGLSPLSNTLALSTLRLVGATFLHALVSGLFGYFIAQSMLNPKKRRLYFFSGLTLAVLLHGAFNFSILETEGITRILIPAFILLTSAVFVSWGFRRLKNIKSINT